MSPIIDFYLGYYAKHRSINNIFDTGFSPSCFVRRSQWSCALRKKRKK